MLKGRGVSARFRLAGAPDPGNPASIPNRVLEAWRSEGVVELLGHREDMPELMRHADVAVLPSYHEGVPLFLLEAAATGLPLVASDIEGCRVIVREGINGYVVPPRNVERLAERVAHLLMSDESRKRMGKASREIAITESSNRVVVDKWMRVYRQLLEI